MITKRLVGILFFMVCTYVGFSQDLPRMKVVDGVFYDVEDRPLIRFLTEDWKSAYIYPPIDAVASGNIEFEGGKKAFDNFVDSVYAYHWARDYGLQEINSRTYYVILFDSELNILSIHIVLDAYARKEWGFDKLLKTMIYATDGKWRKLRPKEQSKYYYWLGGFHFI